MQFIPPLSAILLLIGTTFSLQAIPMFGEGEGRAGQKSALVAEKEEAAGRRISESSSAGGASMNEGHYFSRQNGPKKIQSSSMERTSISSGTAGAATDSTVLPSTEEQDPHASEPAATTGDSFQGHSVAAVEPKPLYRLAPEGWQEKMSGTEEWQSTDHFDNTTPTFLRSSALRHSLELQTFDVVSLSYSRFETIDKRKAACQAELSQEEIKNSSPESEQRIFGLQHLIAVLEQANIYQCKINIHLESLSYSKVGLETFRLESSSKINESPNKIEKIAHQLEVDIKDLLTHQALLDIVEAYIDPHITLGEHPPQHLLNTRQVLIDCISHQKAFIEAKTAYAKSLPPPYEVIDKATQTAIDQRALTCRRESFLARILNPLTYHLECKELNAASSSHYEAEARQQAVLEAQQPQPQERVTALFTQAADLFQQAATAHATGDRNRGIALSTAGRSFVRAALEAQLPQPQEQVITWFTQAADLFQQAAAAYATGYKALLSNAGRSFVRAAEEAHQPQPREQVIALFTQAADLYQQSAAAYATGDTNRGSALSAAGHFFLNAAEEAQQPQPDQAIIDRNVRNAQGNIEKADSSGSCAIS